MARACMQMLGFKGFGLEKKGRREMRIEGLGNNDGPNKNKEERVGPAVKLCISGGGSV